MQELEILNRLYHLSLGGTDNQVVFFADDRDKARAKREAFGRNPSAVHALGARILSKPSDGIVPNVITNAKW